MKSEIMSVGVGSRRLEYILDMMDQLAVLANGMDEFQLGDMLRSTADMRRACASIPDEISAKRFHVLQV